MKSGRMQCKDIPDLPILKFLADLDGEWANWYFGDERDVHRVMPVDVPDKLVVRKMGRLIERGLVGGCGCGCRGDFVITQEGKEFLLHHTKTSE